MSLSHLSAEACSLIHTPSCLLLLLTSTHHATLILTATLSHLLSERILLNATSLHKLLLSHGLICRLRAILLQGEHVQDLQHLR